MYNDKIESDLARLNFEDFLWLIFGILCFINIYGDYNDKEYLKTKNKIFKDNSNQIFTFTLIVTLLIYIYFFIRNYKAYESVSEEKKQLYTVKVLGSSFLIAGVICLLYFQTKQHSFVGGPAL